MQLSGVDTVDRPPLLLFLSTIIVPNDTVLPILLVVELMLDELFPLLDAPLLEDEVFAAGVDESINTQTPFTIGGHTQTPFS